MEKGEHLCSVDGNITSAVIVENWRFFFLENMEIDLPYNAAIPLLHIYLKDLNTMHERDTCSTAHNNQNLEPKSLHSGKWIKKM